MKVVIGGLLLLSAAVVMVTLEQRTGKTGESRTVAPPDRPAVEWSVSKGYTLANKEVPGVMLASAKSLDGKAEISVRCSPGFSAVYMNPGTQPAPEAGTESATYIRSVDGTPEVVGHAAMAGRNMTVGDAAIVRQLAHSRGLRIRFTPYDSPELTTLDFDLRGLRGALAAMGGACGVI